MHSWLILNCGLQNLFMKMIFKFPNPQIPKLYSVPFLNQKGLHFYSLITLNQDLSVLHRTACATVLFQFFSKLNQVIRFPNKSDNCGNRFPSAMPGIQNNTKALTGRGKGF